MKTIQDYINRYSTIARNLGYTGQSVEVLVQLLSQASYISEIENASYMSEASLEKCSLMNSKIQHCVDRMYSVFRGSCPRVIMKIRPTKYITLNPYDKLIDSQNFTVHYLGYYQVLDNQDNIVRGNNEESKDNENIDPENESNKITLVQNDIKDDNRVIDISNLSSAEPDIKNYLIDTPEVIPNESLDELLKYKGFKGRWQYSTATFLPSVNEEDNTNIQIIVGFISPNKESTNLRIDKEITKSNTYYIDCLENNLSDDMYIELGSINNGDLKRESRTRNFSEHILNHRIFDLTLPGFGSRLYLANYYKDTIGRDSNEVSGITENTRIIAQYYKYSKLSDYNDSELKKLQLKGADLLKFNSWEDEDGNIQANEFLVTEGLEEFNNGLCYISEIPRDSLGTIHYKANRDRFVNSIIRSNSDIGTVLEESFPDIIINGGTSYLFKSSNSETKNSSIDLFYIPKTTNKLISDSEAEKFIKEKRAYYIITTKISIIPGIRYIAMFNIDLELYKNSSENNFETELGKNILINNYEKKFNIVFNDSCKKEIESLINKIPNIKKINGFSITYSDSAGRSIVPNPELSGQYYFDIKYSITTKLSQSL